MRMTKAMKILLGAATAWPIVYMVGFSAIVFSAAMGAVMGGVNGGGSAPPTVGSMAPMFVLHAFTMLETLGLLVFYVVHAIKNDKLDQNTRLLWAVVIFVGNVLAMPIYYFLHVWPDHSEPASNPLQRMARRSAGDSTARATKP